MLHLSIHQIQPLTGGAIHLVYLSIYLFNNKNHIFWYNISKRADNKLKMKTYSNIIGIMNCCFFFSLINYKDTSNSAGNSLI